MDPTVSDSLHMPRPPRARRSPAARAGTVWRLALSWQGTVLDVVTLNRSRASLKLRTGDVLEVQSCGTALELLGLGPEPIDVFDGILVELPAGHALVATIAPAEARVGTFASLDSTLFHAAMVGAAVQACVVSALVLAPAPSLDSEPGAGMPGEWRRYLVAPGGTAPNQGTPMLNVVGRKPDEVERAAPVRSAGHRSLAMSGKGMTLEQTLAEMSRVLRLGNDGAELKEAIGDMAQSAARAPVTGADFGGLSPHDPLEAGRGNGLIGAGESRLTEEIRRRIATDEQRAQVQLRKTEPRPAIPVSLAEMSPKDVDVPADTGLDPVVKEALSSAIHRRDNAVQSCYESRGLPKDASRSHRLTLQMVLQPDGHVTDVVVTVDERFSAVADCVKRAVADWYLGDGLVDAPRRLSLPFILTPHKDVKVYDFSNEPVLPR